jgi:hypothetical protein
MFGQGLFGEPPFAIIGVPARLESGWIKQSKRQANPDWVKQDKNLVDTIEADKTPTNWTGIE